MFIFDRNFIYIENNSNDALDNNSILEKLT